MFDFGLSFSHIMVIVVLAVVVIGPKDLPVVLRKFGQFLNRARGMAREFQGHVDSAMKDTGMSDVRRDLAAVATGVSAMMAPVQTALVAAATSAPADSKPATTPALAPVSSVPKLDGGMFAEGPGETRVLGKPLDGTP